MRRAAGGAGAAGARDETAGLYAALDGVLATCEWVRGEGVGVGVPLGLLRRLRRFLDASRAGDAREEATMLADADAVLSKARREWAMAFLTRTWPLPMRDDGESAQAAIRRLFLAGGWSDRGDLDALDCACIAAALWGFQAGYGTARTYPEDADAGDGGH